MTVTHNVDAMIAKIQARVQALRPNGPKMKEALTRIGLYVSSVAKVNVRKQNLIDTGRLINSIRYEFFKDGKDQGVQVGSFNVPYAATHEFGFRGVQRVPTYTRRMTKVFGRKLDSPINVSVGAHTRKMNIKARPYMRPALKSSQTFIVDTLREALLFSKE